MNVRVRTRAIARRALDQALARRHLQITPVEEPRDPYRLADFSPQLTSLWEAIKPFTLTSPERVASLVSAIEFLVDQDINGAFVECGVFRGGSSMAAALTFLRLGDIRDLYLFDTYVGMPEPSASDVDYTGVPASQWWDPDHQRRAFIEHGATLEHVRQRMAGTEYPAEHVHLIKGMVEDTIPAQAPQEIAFLRLDTDFYDSTRHELEQLWPRVVPGGFVMIDDYGHFDGARRAVDEFFASEAVLSTTDRPAHAQPFLHRIDYSGRLIVKPEDRRAQRSPR